jgi:hypothetical protein
MLDRGSEGRSISGCNSVEGWSVDTTLRALSISPFQEKRKLNFLDPPASGALSEVQSD